MIRINLLKNRGEVTRATSATQVNYESTFDNLSAEESSASESKGQILKIIILASGLAMLMGYESYNIGVIRGQISEFNGKKNRALKEIQEKKPIAEKARDLQKKIQDIEARIKAIKDLSRFRLREIKAIDYIQNVIPEKVWLTSLEFKEDSLRIEGGAITDDELNKFLDSLDGKSYFTNVVLLKAVEEKRKDGTVKFFQVSSNLKSTD